jgi:hypothetical protein
MSADMTPGATRLLFGDALIGVLLVNEVRHRIVQAVFGVPRESSNHMSMVAAGLLADGAGAQAAKLLAVPALPSIAVVALGGAAAGETIRTLAGPWSRAVPGAVGLIGVAVVGKSFVPMLRDSVYGAEAAGRAMRSVGRAFRAAAEGTGLPGRRTAGARVS